MQELSTFEEIVNFFKTADSFLWMIVAQWCCGVAIVIMKYKKLRQYQVDSASFFEEVKKFVLNNEIRYAIQLCSRSTSMMARVFKPALARANQSRQQIQDMVEASIIECQRNANKNLGYIGLIANFSTLFGLLGTIHGLIVSFSGLAGADPSEKARLLALGIATAMNATAVGIVSAVTLLFCHSVLSAKSHHIISELDEYSMRLVDLIGTRKNEEYLDDEKAA